MNLDGSTALVTGANRGLGARLVGELLGAGARRVYAAARDPRSVDPHTSADPRVRVLALDVTDDHSGRAAAERATDVILLITNAGVRGFGCALDGDLGLFQRDLASNYLGTLRVSRAFVPVLEANHPAAIINILTLIALAPVPPM